ncbi:MAG: hypothetical protein D6815_00015 [Candidatus Dadabacteria bacterium]|nr:MAG: hypothetical protein D6815_00015 [Candidatus Dadabacteria bacterium]
MASGCSRQPQPVEVVLSLKGRPATVAKASVAIDYSQAGAHPLARSGKIACTSILPDVDITFSDDGKGHLTADINAPSGLSLPSDFAVCRMVPEGTGVTGDSVEKRLRIRLLAAKDQQGKTVAAAPGRRASQRSEKKATGAAAKPMARPASGTAAPVQQPRKPTTGAAARVQPPAQAPQLTPQVPSAAGAGKAQPAPSNVPQAGSSGAARGLLPPKGETQPSRPAGGGAAQPSAPVAPAAPAPGPTNEETDLDRKAASYRVTFGVTDAVGPLGALQFKVEFLGASGGWAGAGGNVHCSDELSGVLAAHNDQGHGTFQAGFVTTEGFETPTAVTTCVFKSRDQVTADLFRITVISAADPEGNELDYVPVEVTDLRRID